MIYERGPRGSKAYEVKITPAVDLVNLVSLSVWSRRRAGQDEASLPAPADERSRFGGSADEVEKPGRVW